MAEQEAANQATDQPASHAKLPPELVHAGILWRIKAWTLQEGPWWLCSFVFHLVLVCSLALMSGKVVEKIVDEAPSFDEANVQRPTDVPQEIERFEVGQTPDDPTELNVDTLTLEQPAPMAQEEKYYDDSATFIEKGGGVAASANQPNLGGLGGFDIKGLGPGPAVKGKGGVGVGVGSGIHPGSGGGTRQSERAVTGALNWIARHQSLDGSWSLTAYQARCKDSSCVGEAKVGGYEAAATALALLPFLASGQTHESKGRSRQTVKAGISYLIKNQKPDGDLRMGSTMYAHGLASIVLCECYGMSNDKAVGRAAQRALNFIMEAQDPTGGGWRYEPRTPGDTSVTGWQIMALRSGQMAYLIVHPAVFEKAKAFLKSVVSKQYGAGRFTYMPDKSPLRDDGRVIDDGRAMTAVELLCQQYMHMPRTDPAMMEGTAFLMQNQPDAGERDLYYWYYATQVMHNQPGPGWDAWNRKMRHTLIDTQCKEDNCAAGSWDPKLPKPDLWGSYGGRLYMTSLAALTLEVYYSYLPLYKLDKEGGGGAAQPTKKTTK